MALEEGVPRQRRDAEPRESHHGAGRQPPLPPPVHDQCDGHCRRARQHFGSQHAKPPPHGAGHRNRVMLVDRVGNVEAARDEPGANRRLAVNHKPQAAPPREGSQAVRRSTRPRRTPAPSRHRATTVAASSAPATGHASYRVISASASAPDARSHRLRAPSSSAATVHHKARPIRPSNSGSVIGVDCRYSRLGLVTMTSTAATAPAREPVKRRINCAVLQASSAMLTIEIAIADAPVRYHASTCTGTRLSKWGRGQPHGAELQPSGRQAVEHATGHDEVAFRVVVAQRQPLLPIDQCRDQAPAERQPRERQWQVRTVEGRRLGRLYFSQTGRS